MGKMQQKYSPETDPHVLSTDLWRGEHCNVMGKGWAF